MERYARNLVVPQEKRALANRQNIRNNTSIGRSVWDNWQRQLARVIFNQPIDPATHTRTFVLTFRHHTVGSLSPCHPYFQLTMSTTRARHQHIHVPAQEHKQKPPKPPFRLRTRRCVWWCTFFRFFFSSLVFLCLAADLRNPKQSENTCFRMRNSGPSCRRSDRIGEGVDMGWHGHDVKTEVA